MTAQLMSAVLLVLGMALTFGGLVAWSRGGERCGALPRGDQSPLDLGVKRRGWATLRSWLPRRHLNFICSHIAILLLCGLVTPALAEPVVVNGDFETNAGSFTTWPGYLGQPGNPTEIPGWTSHTGLDGINPGNLPSPSGQGSNAPFRNNGADLTNVAFLQQFASLSQTIPGFTVGNSYSVDFIYNSRDSRALSNGVNPTMQVSIFGQTLTVPDIPPRDPAGTFVDPYTSASLNFNATATTGDLMFSAAPVTPGDSTLLIDNISIRAALGGPAAVPEPSSIVLMGVGSALLLGITAVRTSRRSTTPVATVEHH